MTFENTAFAIDGTMLSSSLARRATFAGVNGAEGVVQSADLKVTQLAVPGVGILVGPGVGLVSNKYLDTPNESYVVSNPESHTVPSIEMPASNPSPKSYIVAVVVGDPEFSQVGHPWMGSDDPPIGEELTFEYVRVTLIEVSAGVTTLPADYPALVLARLDIPASTTTITDAMITDLRSLAQPRQWSEIFISPVGTWSVINNMSDGAVYADWGTAQYSPSVTVPTWAKRAIIRTSINMVEVVDSSVNIGAVVRTHIGALTTPQTNIDIASGSGQYRFDIDNDADIDVSSIAGTTVALKVQAFQSVPGTPTSNQRIRLRHAQMVFDIRFLEE